MLCSMGIACVYHASQANSCTLEKVPRLYHVQPTLHARANDMCGCVLQLDLAYNFTTNVHSDIVCSGMQNSKIFCMWEMVQ